MSRSRGNATAKGSVGPNIPGKSLAGVGGVKPPRGAGETTRRHSGRMKRTSSPAVPVTSRPCSRPGSSRPSATTARSTASTCTSAPGEVFGVLGPNGAGKTTTLRMLATLLQHRRRPRQHLRPSTSRRSRTGPPAGRRHRAVRLGRRESHRHREPLLFAPPARAQRRRRRGARPPSCSSSSASTEAADRPITKFSGGMRRRLDLAASLIAQPPLIFLDEPTTGLDPRTRGQMWDTIRGLVARRLDGPAHHAVPRRGRPARRPHRRHRPRPQGRRGHADELKASVGTSTLHLRLADPDRPRRGARRDRARARREARVTPEAGRLTVPLTDADRAADVLIALRDAGIELARVSVQKPTLDEVFLALTGHDADDETDATGDGAATDATDHDLEARPHEHHHRHRPRRAATPGEPRRLGRDRQPDPDAWPGGRSRRCAATRSSSSTSPCSRSCSPRCSPTSSAARSPATCRATCRSSSPASSRQTVADDLHGHRHPAPRGHGQGRLRPVQVAADRADRAAGRSDGGRPAALHHRDDADLRDGPAHGLPPRRRDRRRGRRGPARRSSAAGRWRGSSPSSAPSPAAPRACRASR